MTKTVFILSGGSGRTAESVLKAVAAQYPDCELDIQPRTEIRTHEQAKAVLLEAARQGGMVLHTLVSPEIRHTVDNEALHLGLRSVDLMGPALSALGEYLRLEPRRQPGLLYELNREQFDRLDAVDFTMAHDDGNRLSSLHRADVVLVGVSRVSKSVTCFYLASRGVRAANVPLVPGHQPPGELLSLDSNKVIGLTMNARHLASIRQARMERLASSAVPRYAEIRELNSELRQATQWMEEYGWRTLDVSYKATEEVAAQIIELLGLGLSVQ